MFSSVAQEAGGTKEAKLTAGYSERSVAWIYWPPGVITLTGSLLVVLFLLGSIYKCHRASNLTVSPLSLERTAAILWRGLITYC